VGPKNTQNRSTDPLEPIFFVAIFTFFAFFAIFVLFLTFLVIYSLNNASDERVGGGRTSFFDEK
jgi:hypothetical protein